MASLVEMFRMPMHQIEEQFTKSEITLIAWRSQESAMHMRKKMKAASDPHKLSHADATNVIDFPHKTPEQLAAESLPPSLRNVKQGDELDLSKMSSKDALAYLSSQGLNFGLIFPVDDPNLPTPKGK